MRGAPLLALLVACGGVAQRPTPPLPKTHPSASASASAPPVPVDSLASFDSIAIASRTAWPGTRESLRQEATVKDTVSMDVPTATADTCVRIFVRATAPISAKLIGKGDAVLAEAEGIELTLASKGPVCVRKGDPLRIALKGDGRVRVLARSSP